MPITVLNKKDVEDFIQLFIKWALEQTPPWYFDKKRVLDRLQKMNVFLYKEKERILWLMTFEINSQEIMIDFLYAKVKRKGIWTALILELKKAALKNNISVISTTVSSLSYWAQDFYAWLWFKKTWEKEIFSGEIYFTVYIIQLTI